MVLNSQWQEECSFVSLPPRMRHVISAVLTNCLGVRCRRILIQYFPGMSYGQENIENLVRVN
jgi:hypothetical protein